MSSDFAFHFVHSGPSNFVHFNSFSKRTKFFSSRLYSLQSSKRVHINPQFITKCTADGSKSFDQLQSSTTQDPAQSKKLSDKSLKYTLFGVSFSLPGRFILAIVPLLWASYSICLKWMYRFQWSINPAIFNLLRLSVGTLVVLPSFVRDYKKNRNDPAYNPWSFLRAGLELGFFTFIVNILQINGLKYTSASRGTFLSQLATIIVPFAAFIFGMEKRIGLNVIIASIISVLGVAMLSFDSLANPFTWRGDGLLLLVAFVAAAFILRSKIFSSTVPTRPLVAVKVFGQNAYALLYSANIFLQPMSKPISTLFVNATPLYLFLNIAFILWAGFFIGYLSTELQMQGQKLVSASEAAIIFTSTPIWASILAIPLGERFGLQGALGAFLILAATILASTENFPFKKKQLEQ